MRPVKRVTFSFNVYKYFKFI